MLQNRGLKTKSHSLAPAELAPVINYRAQTFAVRRTRRTRNSTCFLSPGFCRVTSGDLASQSNEYNSSVTSPCDSPLASLTPNHAKLQITGVQALSFVEDCEIGCNNRFQPNALLKSRWLFNNKVCRDKVWSLYYHAIT